MIPRLAIPVRLTNAGSFATVDQDSVDDIAQCVRAVLTTPIGSRVEQPDFGVHDWVFSTPSPPDLVVDAVLSWEPRADISVSDIHGVGGDELVERVTAEVRSR